MKNEILTSNGIPIQLIRYFNYQNKDYLIFTKENDADAQGYITIHISEVTNDNGLTAIVVDDQISKDIIKYITNANKNNMPLDIIDLNYNNIDGINMLGDKAYKVLPNYVEILSKNQPLFENDNANEELNKSTLENSYESSSDKATELANDSFDNTEFNFNNNPFDINQQTVLNSNENMSNDVQQQVSDDDTSDDNSVTDYEKLYLEQLELVKNLKSENEIYKNKIEMLKNIINN